jgi:hypothetical protein
MPEQLIILHTQDEIAIKLTSYQPRMNKWLFRMTYKKQLRSTSVHSIKKIIQSELIN